MVGARQGAAAGRRPCSPRLRRSGNRTPPWCGFYWNAAVEVSVRPIVWTRFVVSPSASSIRGWNAPTLSRKSSWFVTERNGAMLPLSLPSPLGQAKIYLYAKPLDMRKSFDGLHAIVQSDSSATSARGCVSVSQPPPGSHQADPLGSGRLGDLDEAFGTRHFPETARHAQRSAQVEMDATDLALLLSGIELASVKRRRRYAFDAAKPTALETRRLVTAGTSPCGKLFWKFFQFETISSFAFWRSCYHQSHDRAPRIPHDLACLPNAAASSRRDLAEESATIASQAATIASQTGKIEELTTEMEKLRKLLSQFVHGHRTRNASFRLPLRRCCLSTASEEFQAARAEAEAQAEAIVRRHGDAHRDEEETGRIAAQPSAAGREGYRGQRGTDELFGTRPAGTHRLRHRPRRWSTSVPSCTCW